MDVKKDYGQPLLIFVFGLLSLIVVDYSMKQLGETNRTPKQLGHPS